MRVHPAEVLVSQRPIRSFITTVGIFVALFPLALLGFTTVYRNWTDDDVPWIITPQERATFYKLTNDEERDRFIDQFWYRRDPTPDTLDNEFQDEYYRRVIFANENYSTRSTRGWRTDRGRTLIVFGPPDQIIGGAETALQGALAKSETWKYRHLKGVGDDIALNFVDRSGAGNYVLELPDGKEAVKFFQAAIPPAPLDPAIAESMRNHPIQPGFYGYVGGVMKPPTIRFKDLEQLVTHKVSLYYFPVTLNTTQTSATTNVSVLKAAVGIPKTETIKGVIGSGGIQIYGRITTMSGEIVATREIQIEPPDSRAHDSSSSATKATLTFPLFPARYRLDIAVNDVRTDYKTTASYGVIVRENPE